MAYASEFHIIHDTKTRNTATTFRIELQKNGFVGGSTELRSTGDIFTHEYEQIDSTKPFEKPAQKSRLELHFLIQNATHLAILETVFASDENQYRLVKKVDGVTVWTGKVLPDMLQYSEGPYPFQGSIISKDLSGLSGINFPLTDDRKTIIATIADLLDDLGLGLDIYTYTSWTEDSLLSSDDFLGTIFNDRFALRDYARTGDETDQPLKHDDLLDRILRNYGLILRQDEGAWRIYQLTAFTDPTAVKEYRYDSTGILVSSSTVDMTTSVDRVVRFILPSSVNMVNPAIKQGVVTFDHRTRVSNIRFPIQVKITGAQQETFSQFFNTDGNQSITLSCGFIEVEMDDTNSSVEVKVRIQAGSYYWDDENIEWTLTATDITIPLTITKPLPAGKERAIGSFGDTSGIIQTIVTPADADGDLIVTLNGALGDVSAADTTTYSDLGFTILNPVADANTTSIVYEISQTGNFSKIYDHGEVWFGDGPANYSRSALSSDLAGSILTNDSWKRKGELNDINFFNLLLREILDTQRSATRNLDGDLWGEYSTKNLISYDAGFLFFMGGTLIGKQNIWNARFLELNIQTDA